MKISGCRTFKSFLWITGSIISINCAYAQVINPIGANNLHYGTGSGANMNVGDYVVYESAGPGYDLVLQLNARATNTLVNASNSTDFFNVTQASGLSQKNIWAEVTIFFAQAGTTSSSNPRGNALFLLGVTSFIGKDIDSGTSTTNFTDVIGLYDTVGASSVTVGSALGSGGFQELVNLPPTGAESYRLLGTDWTLPSNVAVTDTNNWVTWNYSGESIDRFRFVWGATTGDGGSYSGARGNALEINFSGSFSPVPEPSSALLVGLASLVLLAHRNRRTLE